MLQGWKFTKQFDNFCIFSQNIGLGFKYLSHSYLVHDFGVIILAVSDMLRQLLAVFESLYQDFMPSHWGILKISLNNNYAWQSSYLETFISKVENGASLVAQWLRICLLMQGTRVRALVWEDPTCRGAAGPMSHNYWACASGACAPQQERPR